MYTSQGSNLDRRAFPRQPIQMDAYISSPRLMRCDVEIRDFCLGGFFLVPRDPQATYIQLREHTGETITVHFSCATSAGNKNFSLNVRIVRVSEGGIGAAFSETGPAVLQALHFLTAQARQTPSKPKLGTKQTRSLNEPKNREGSNALLEACRKQVADYFPIILKDFFEQLDETLFLCARDAENNLEQTFYLEAIEEIKGHRQQVEEKCQKTLLAQLEDLSANTRGTLPPQENQAESSKLAVVGKEEFEDWLAIAEAVSKMEAYYADPLFEVEKRFARLLGISVDKENNPVGPRAICRALQDAIRDLEIGHYIKQRIYKVFKEAAEDKLGVLYNRLNELLKAEGILPSLERKFATPQGQSAQNGAASFSEQPVAPHGVTSSPPSEQEEPSRGRITPEAMPPSPVQKSVPQEAFGLERPQEPVPALAAAEAYRVTRELLGLYKLRGQRSRGSYTSAGSLKREEELLEALADLSPDQKANTGSEDRVADLLAQLSPKITPQERAAHDEPSSSEAHDLIEIVGNLLVSILEDKALPENARSWIRQLEIPLLRLAVLDKAFVDKETHPARQVLNLLAQFEIPPSEERDEADAQFEARIAHLVNYIAHDFEHDVGIFSKVLKELKRIAEQRTQSVSSNIAQVVESYQAQQQLKKNRRMIAETPQGLKAGASRGKVWGHQAPTLKDQEKDSENWVNRAKRLPLNSWVQFTDRQGCPRRLQLVWVAEDFTTFVFVDAKGKKAATLSLNEVAMQLRRGTATMLDDANVPLLDRAQYAVLQRFHNHIAYEATHDPLTGLINRKEFEKRMNHALVRAKHEHHQHVLLYLDLDQFKIINSTCGYEAGDALLKEIAQLLAQFVADRGILARLGDNEFGVLLTQCSLREGYKIAEQQRIAIENYQLAWNNKRLSVGVSIGLVAVSDQNRDAAILLQRVETACTKAKEAGRNRIRVCELDDEEFVRRHSMVEWVARIGEVLEDNRLQLWCQRIIPIAIHSAMEPHYEILLRFRDQDGQWIAAGEFIQTAEFYHRMAAIDRWVVQSVLQWMADHRERLEQLGGVAINLSGQSLSDERLAEFVKREFHRTGAPPHRVCFEATETAGVASLSSSARFIQEMKTLGCYFSLDDFGSGLSSYSYLKNLPVDYLKIDGTFVKDITTNPNDYAVVKSINEIGHFMGKKVIAEYVENKAILAKLQEIGVDFAQGYGIEPPQLLRAME
ncbi:diguanylate cyclase [Nitrosococcus halophilus Nc 4]|uniref:Diguanylate cyclase n=1 Tax=Nitrosococcus halophilus (strain Nc4) TaxID=472759 RepID=D5C229_NITHN|nr:DUF1631 family protein [Nitrosococcus halophilus]ADE16617.1 diguanylate cyclase [Nitrosococcus halophilus Nc 4]